MRLKYINCALFSANTAAVAVPTDQTAAQHSENTAATGVHS